MPLLPGEPARFRQMDGYPPYEALKREREKRIERIRTELVRIEAEAGLDTEQKALQAPGPTG